MFMLDEIVAYKIIEVQEKKHHRPVQELKSKLADARPPRKFYEALTEPGISLIAEVKRKSPSKGELRPNFAPLELARSYSNNGARAISVLADKQFFGGGAEVVEAVAGDPRVHLPVLYKEFVLDLYQIYEARSVGADAVLLITRIIEPDRLSDMIAQVYDLGMQALVECFTAEEALRAVAAGAKIIGINNRDLQSFEVNLHRSEEMRSVLPPSIVTVSESGLSSREDALKAQELGFDAMLVGEALLKAKDLDQRVREFAGLVNEHK